MVHSRSNGWLETIKGHGDIRTITMSHGKSAPQTESYTQGKNKRKKEKEQHKSSHQNFNTSCVWVLER